MRIAYLVNQYPKTSHSFIRREIRGVEALGVEVLRYSIRAVTEPLVEPDDRDEAQRTVVLLTRGARTVACELARAALVRPLALLRGLRAALRLAASSAGKRLHHLAYLGEACRLLRLLRAARVEHLHAHFGTNATAVAVLCRALGGPPFSFTVHSPGSSEVPELVALSEKMRTARFVCAVSQHGRSQLLRWSEPSAWEAVHLVRCGADAGFLDAPETPPPAEPRLVCVARLSAEKGHAVLLRAFARVVAERPGAELALVGDGPLRASLEALAAELGIAERVRFLGWQSGETVRAEVLAARALVLPSFVEGLPVVVMEALALRRPVIATYVGGVPELVEPGASGWLVPAGAVDELAAACREALDATPEQLLNLGRRGARAVHERHDARDESARLVELIRSPTVNEAA